MVSKERQDLVLKLARFESAGVSGGEAFDGFGDAGNSGTVTDPVEDPSLMWDRAVSRMHAWMMPAAQRPILVRTFPAQASVY